jgi:predicted kinase
MHILQGYPACGKTTWARGWRNQDPSRIRISRDDLRRMIRGGWTGNRADEDLITAMAETGVAEALRAGRDVVVDATHIRPQDLERMLQLGQAFGAHTVLHRWPTNVRVCISRDARRPTSERVGHGVIQGMADVLANTEREQARLRELFDRVIIHV